MSPKEPVCQQLQELRNRLNRLKISGDTPRNAARRSEKVSFQKDWQAGWLRIVGLLGEIDQMLNRSLGRKTWDQGQPAILRFPPAEEGIVSMGPF